MNRNPFRIPTALLGAAVFLTLLCGLPEVRAQEGSSAPGAKENEASSSSPYPIDVFQRYISPVDGDRCPMHPSCSGYAAEAVKKHGPVMGWIMACDRLLRCGRDEVRLSPMIRVNGRNRTHDPVERNDFWW